MGINEEEFKLKIDILEIINKIRFLKIYSYKSILKYRTSILSFKVGSEFKILVLKH